MVSDVFSEEESDIIERVVRQLDAVYDIAPQSRRAAKQRIAEAAERRAKIQTTVPTGDHHSLGLGLNQQYPQNELVEALQTLPEEDLDGLLKAFKKFQMSKQVSYKKNTKAMRIYLLRVLRVHAQWFLDNNC